MSTDEELKATVRDLVQEGKGILAADESQPTIAKRFQPVGIESTEENRRAYRSLLLTAPGLGQYLSGVILFEETLGQKADDGTALPLAAQRQGIVPGIKVDKGTTALANAPGDLVTQGLDGLAERLRGYKALGARFAKWREVYPVSARNPTTLGMAVNAEVLARYAAICQEQGLVPIVEPEVLLDGDHSIERCSEVTEAVLQAVFHALQRHKVVLESMLLKPSMVVPGKDCARKAGPEEVARETLKVLRRSVPAAVPSINFLSGGQTPAQATANLNAMNAASMRAPWGLSFSYARALQQPVLDAWRGRPENVKAAQEALCLRARLNAAARKGQYRPEMEPAG
ncbi:putative fructose-bisphosphate aldolase class 1 [Burkholderiales bacterium]|nr:putative fructose-bisphosphate aldolase class 1 [Burkholderiales bacterium]